MFTLCSRRPNDIVAFRSENLYCSCDISLVGDETPLWYDVIWIAIVDEKRASLDLVPAKLFTYWPRTEYSCGRALMQRPKIEPRTFSRFSEIFQSHDTSLHHRVPPDDFFWIGSRSSHGAIGVLKKRSSEFRIFEGHHSNWDWVRGSWTINSHNLAQRKRSSTSFIRSWTVCFTSPRPPAPSLRFIFTHLRKVSLDLQECTIVGWIISCSEIQMIK